MAGVCRLGDHAKAPLDAHGCPACPHPNVEGPALTASFNVFVNGAPALRKGDMGMHAACCGKNQWKVMRASGQVFINGQKMVRKNDPTRHCGGIGKMIEASGNVHDGSAEEGESTEELMEQIEEWLERIQENGIAELLHMVSPGLGAAYFAAGELGKLFSPECRGSEYFKHLAKCLPAKPPGEPGGPDGPGPQHPVPSVRRGPRYAPDPGAEPVGFFDLDNPITDVALLAGGGLAKGGELAVEGGVRGGRLAVHGVAKAGKWIGEGAGDLAGRAGGLVSGGAHALGFG
jgi:uncharacterized Zn-binding protein involved in type VI secretion